MHEIKQRVATTGKPKDEKGMFFSSTFSCPPRSPKLTTSRPAGYLYLQTGDYVFLRDVNAGGNPMEDHHFVNVIDV